jgi:hypothetical protein
MKFPEPNNHPGRLSENGMLEVARGPEMENPNSSVPDFQDTVHG